MKKQCNNCGVITVESAEVCLHCRMTNDFKPIIEEKSIPIIQPPGKQSCCPNCGSNIDDVKNDRCSECRFPLAQQKTKALVVNFFPPKMNRLCLDSH